MSPWLFVDQTVSRRGTERRENKRALLSLGEGDTISSTGLCLLRLLQVAAAASPIGSEARSVPALVQILYPHLCEVLVLKATFKGLSTCVFSFVCGA